VYKARAGDSWPEISTDANGSLYADSYLATTGGSLITVTSSGSINSVIDSANDGDAILLAPGTYSTTPDNSIGSRDGFRLKSLLIVGDTDDPADVVVEHNPDGDGGQRDHPVFSGSGYTSINTNKQIAFCTYRRNADTYLGTNYSNSLTKNFDLNEGIAVNVYFDLDNEGVSWHYDNTGSSNNDVRFIRCTFANYSTWQSSYSGRDDQIDVEDCLFSGSTDTTEYVDLGGNVTSATIDETNRTYNTGTYSSTGHLYIPNTNAIF